MPIFKRKCDNRKIFIEIYKEFIECYGFEITSDFDPIKSTIICLRNPKTGTMHVIWY